MKKKISSRHHGGTTQGRHTLVKLGDFVSWWFKKKSQGGAKIVSCAILIFTVTLLYGQNSSVKKPVAKTSATTPQLKTLEDSANYAMGLSIANFYRQQGVTKINSTLVIKAINDAMNRASDVCIWGVGNLPDLFQATYYAHQ